MSEQSEPGTRTVRIDAEAAKRLQTIAALKEEMGERFKSVEYLNGLVAGPIEELHAETLAAYSDYKAKQAKGTKKRS